LANITDFDVSADTLNAIINPSRSPHSYWIGAALSGTGTGNATSQFVDTSQTFRANEYNDFYLVLDSGRSRNLIESTSGATLTVDGSVNLSSFAAAAYSIESERPLSIATATAIVTRVVGEIKSQLPEKYRKMLYEINGEYIVDHAYHHQATAHTTFKVADTNRLYLWRNLRGPWQDRWNTSRALYSPIDESQGLTGFSDYSIGTGTPTVVTFKFGGNASEYLVRDDRIIAEYPHNLETVPKILHQVALHVSAYEILWQSGLGVEEIPGHIVAYKTRADEIMAGIKDGSIGIDEFDRINLFVETRSDGAGGGYSSVLVQRG
jgi:hypothetical protein